MKPGGVPYSKACKQCRLRRIRCDETRPACLNCQKRKIDCAGFTQVFRFVEQAKVWETKAARTRPRRASLEIHQVVFLNRASPPHTQSSTPTVSEGEDGDLEASTAVEIRAAVTMNSHIGGLRTHSFNVFPIQNRAHVSAAFDYFAEVYAASTLRADCREVRRSYYHLLLSDAMFFDSVVAFSIVLQRKAQNCDILASPEVMYHSQNALVALRRRLQTLSTESTSDAVILTILMFCGLTYVMGDSEAYSIHIKGLRRIVPLRDGLVSGGMEGFLKRRVQAVEGVWTMKQKRLHTTNRLSKDKTSANGLTYPTHPFPPELCLRISTYSPGFRSLSLTACLSLEFFDCLDPINKWVKGSKSSLEIDSAIFEVRSGLDALLCSAELHLAERLVSIALFAYAIFVQRTLQVHMPMISESYLYPHIKRLEVVDGVLTFGRDLFAWTCLVVSAGCEVNSEPWRWAQRQFPRILMYELDVERLEVDYLPIPKWTVDSRIEMSS